MKNFDYHLKITQSDLVSYNIMSDEKIYIMLSNEKIVKNEVMYN